MRYVGMAHSKWAKSCGDTTPPTPGGDRRCRGCRYAVRLADVARRTWLRLGRDLRHQSGGTEHVPA